jgi:hypothetical protein
MFFIVTILANLLPLVLGVLWTIVRDKWTSWEPFYAAGEFYIYSAALLGPSCYIFYTHKKKNYDRLSILFMLSSLVALFSSILYAFLIVDKTQFSHAVLEPSSYGILAYTVLVYYYANLTDQAKRVDILGQAREEIDEIKNQLGGH